MATVTRMFTIIEFIPVVFSELLFRKNFKFSYPISTSRSIYVTEGGEAVKTIDPF